MSDVNDQITNAMRQALRSQENVTPTVPTEPQVPQTPQTPSTPQAINLGDDALVTYKVGGQEFTKPWQEILKTQVLLPGDYTKKTQALASERQTWETQRHTEAAARQAWEQERQQIVTALQDPQKVGALYLAALRRAKEQGQSPAQAQATAHAAVHPDQILAQIDQRLNQRFSEYQTNVASTQIAQEMDHFMGRLKKGTSVEHLPGVDDYIYGQVEAMKPADVSQAKDYAKLVFEDYVRKFTDTLTNFQKSQLVNQGKLTQGIEPPGGAVVPPAQKLYKGPKDPERARDMLAYMQQRLAAG